MRTRSLVLPLLFLPLLRCSTPTNTPDATVDGSVPDSVAPPDASSAEAGPATRIADVPATNRTLPGLDGPADVVLDRYGWPHVYATTLHDAMMLEGYVMARDRMAQMEVLRRVSSGTLAEAFGSLSSTLIERDIANRVMGLRRAAVNIWAQTPAGRGRVALEAFSQGVNAYLNQIRSGDLSAPSGTDLVVTVNTPDWTPVDSLTLGRFQVMALSYTADNESDASTLTERVRSVFDAASAPELRARNFFDLDFLRFAPASSEVVLPDFLSRLPAPQRIESTAVSPRLSPQALAGTQSFHRALRDSLELLGDQNRGSNNWVVAPSRSATGHALLANDTHLQLPSPPIWYGLHVTVTQGPDAADVAGVTFPGLPGVLLGFNRRVAWGATVAYWDVADLYQETITPGVGGAPPTVRFQGRDVPLQYVDEDVPNGLGGTYRLRIEVVPHHGPILPTIRNGMAVPRTSNTAVSVRWTGFDVSRELDAFVGLMYSTNVADARNALDAYRVGAMNWVYADVAGGAGYSANARVPIRAPGALAFRPEAPAAGSPDLRRGTIPCRILPGDGTAEWTGDLTRTELPWADVNSDRPFVATSNNDQTGVSTTNSPASGRRYYGCRWAHGWRAEQASNRLRTLNTGLTREQMEGVQNDHIVLAGGRFRPFVASAMARLEAEWRTPGTNPDLSALATTTMPRQAQLRDAAARLMAWTLDSPSGVDDAVGSPAQRDSVATTLFHGWLVAFQLALFGDELAALGDSAAGLSFNLGTYDYAAVDASLALLEHPMQAQTWSAAQGQPAIFDDLRTTNTVETRDAIILSALDAALTQLARVAGGADVDTWRWGTLHTVRFESMIPGPGATLSIPQTSDTRFPNGFPRPGGLETVDVGDPGSSNWNFSYGTGPAIRFTVDMDPAGPRAFNVLPGGNDINVRSRHHADEAELWRTNRVHPIAQLEPEVAAAAESRVHYAPQ